MTRYPIYYYRAKRACNHYKYDSVCYNDEVESHIECFNELSRSAREKNIYNIVDYEPSL